MGEIKNMLNMFAYIFGLMLIVLLIFLAYISYVEYQEDEVQICKDECNEQGFLYAKGELSSVWESTCYCKNQYGIYKIS